MTAAPRIIRVWLGDECFEATADELRDDASLRKHFKDLEDHIRVSGLRYFVPVGRGVDFMNDRDNDVRAMIGPNRTGKTAHALIDLLLDLIPCNPEWEIFAKYGVAFREWLGPQKAICSTYKMQLHKRVIWPEIIKWCPRDELVGGAKHKNLGLITPSWDRDPQVRLKCGSQIYFMAYEQDQDVYESMAVQHALWDEQGTESKFDATDERGRTLGGTRHRFSLTPHKVEGRPDSGAGSWIQKLLTGENTKAHDVAQYSISISDMPERIYSQREKERAYKKWVEIPEQTGNIKAKREGRARFYGEWHTTAGLVYDEIDPAVHFIAPFDIDGAFTLYRALDHGTKNPTACLSIAVDDAGFAYAFREYYQRDLGIFVDARNIVEAAGNKLVPRGTFKNHKTGIQYDVFEEDMCNEVYFRSVLDSRSFASEETKLPIGKLYNMAGLHVVPASGKHDAHRIPLVKEMLRVNPDLRNPITGEMGSPRLFFFNTLTNFKREWSGYVWVESRTEAKDPVEKARDKENHLVGSCLGYAAQIPLRYMGEVGARKMRSVKLCGQSYTCSNERTGY